MHSLPVLPIGEQSFSALRQDKAVYVDKTGLLEEMIRCGRWYFLARPRRFGKSLTISTLKAMFEGRKDLFCGLACAKWVEEQSHHPNPVLHLDLSLWGASAPAEKLGGWLSRQLVSLAQGCGVTISAQESASETFLCAIQEIAKKKGPVVVLIDEYDTPVLHCLENRQKLVAIRETLRDFYAVLKGASESLRFF